MVEDIPQVDINPPTMIRSNEHHALAIEHNGLVFVKTPTAWHELAKALEVAHADCESMRKDFEAASDRRQIYMDLAERLRAENARLREALAKYADRRNWDGRHTTAAQRDGDLAQDIWAEDYNGWEAAERALAGCKTNE